MPAENDPASGVYLL